MIRPLFVRQYLTLLLSCVLTSPSLVRADVEPCPTYSNILSLTLVESLDLVAPKMTSKCGDDAISTGLYGGLLLRAGAVEEAVGWLEKSLLLDPEQRGVRADYALALSSLGDSASGRQIASDLLESGSIPKGLTDVLSSLVSLDQWTAAAQFSITGGYSDNIDYVAELSSLDLTFGEDGVTTFPLVEDSIATRASFLQQGLVLNGLYREGHLQVMPSISLSERRSAGSDVSDYTSGQLGLALEYGQTSMYVGLGSTDYGFGLDRDDTRLGVSHLLSTKLGGAGCQPGLQAELWRQRFPSVTTFDADVTRLGLWIDCDAGWQGSVYVTRDRAVGSRIGGNRSGLEAQAGRSIRLRSGQLNLRASVSSEEDADGYSDFLDRGNPRSLTTVRGSAEWLVPITETISLSTSVMTLRQSSNLALFDVKANEIALSIIFLPN